MNDIEKYFDNYRCLADEAGDNPSVTEQDFLGRLHKEQARKRFRARTLALTFIGMAAALAVFVILRGPEVPVNPPENLQDKLLRQVSTVMYGFRLPEVNITAALPAVECTVPVR